MSGHDYTSTQRSQRRRAKLRAERQAAKRAAKLARRAELDARRAARGLPPAMTSTERARLCWEREAQIKTEQWYSAPALSRAEAEQFLKSAHPEETADRVDRLLRVLEDGCRRYELWLNKFVLTYGVEQARLQRAIFEQVMESNFGGDCDRISDAIRIAEKQEMIEIDASLHPSQQYQMRLLWLDQSQVKWGSGNLLNCAA